MYFFRILSAILIYLILGVSVADECKNFEDKVLAIPMPEVGMVTDGQQPKYDLGLFFFQDYNYEKDQIIIKRDSNNYPILKFHL